MIFPDFVLLEQPRHPLIGPHYFSFRCPAENYPPTLTLFSLLPPYSAIIRGGSGSFAYSFNCFCHQPTSRHAPILYPMLRYTPIGLNPIASCSATLAGL